MVAKIYKLMKRRARRGYVALGIFHNEAEAQEIYRWRKSRGADVILIEEVDTAPQWERELIDEVRSE